MEDWFQASVMKPILSIASQNEVIAAQSDGVSSFLFLPHIFVLFSEDIFATLSIDVAWSGMQTTVLT